MQSSVHSSIIYTNTYTYTYIQWNTIHPEKKNEVLSFAATWMDLEGLMISEISQRRTNTV